VSAELTRELESTFGKKGVDFVGPVTGSKGGADKARCDHGGASDLAFERAQPIFKAVGERAIHCGPVGAGTQVKLAGNALIARCSKALRRHAADEEGGVDRASCSRSCRRARFDRRTTTSRVRRSSKRDLTPLLDRLMFKDLMLFLDSAAKAPGADSAHAAAMETYQLARAAGKGSLDITAWSPCSKNLRTADRVNRFTASKFTDFQSRDDASPRAF